MAEATRDPRAAVARMRVAKRVLITSHSAPDGDALGSELGLAEFARGLGLTASVINRDPHPASLAFLPGLEEVQVAERLPDDLERRFDLAVLLECPGPDRPGLAGLERLPILNIDHHLSNSLYGEINFVDESAPAVGEMVLLMVEAAGLKLTPTLATNLYAALVTDTGDFRYSNTTPRAFQAAARLLEGGARPHEIAEALYEHVPARVIALTSAVLATLELLADGKIAVMACDRAMLDRACARPEDTESLINIPRSIDGVEVAVLVKEFTPGTVRVSLRSRSRVDVQAIAGRFGGGGHRQAAGCTIRRPLAEARRELLDALLPAVEST